MKTIISNPLDLIKMSTAMKIPMVSFIVQLSACKTFIAEDYWANDYPDEEEDILLMQSRPLVYDSDTDNSLRHVSSSSDDEEDYTI